MWEEMRRELKRIELLSTTPEDAAYDIMEYLQGTHIEPDRREQVEYVVSEMLERSSTVKALMRKVRPYIRKMVDLHTEELLGGKLANEFNMEGEEDE